MDKAYVATPYHLHDLDWLKRRASEASKEQGISLTRARNALAKTKGFKSWKAMSDQSWSFDPDQEILHGPDFSIRFWNFHYASQITRYAKGYEPHLPEHYGCYEMDGPVFNGQAEVEFDDCRGHEDQSNIFPERTRAYIEDALRAGSHTRALRFFIVAALRVKRMRVSAARKLFKEFRAEIGEAEIWSMSDDTETDPHGIVAVRAPGEGRGRKAKEQALVYYVDFSMPNAFAQMPLEAFQLWVAELPFQIDRAEKVSPAEVMDEICDVALLHGGKVA